MLTAVDNDFDIIESFLSNHASPYEIACMFEDYYSYMIYSDQKMNIMRMLSRVHHGQTGQHLLGEGA